MAVMIMVSGWMDEDEDDKRTFGVLPEKMNLKVVFLWIVLILTRKILFRIFLFTFE